MSSVLKVNGSGLLLFLFDCLILRYLEKRVSYTEDALQVLESVNLGD